MQDYLLMPSISVAEALMTSAWISYSTLAAIDRSLPDATIVWHDGDSDDISDGHQTHLSHGIFLT
jgi:hypothetical protein